MARGESQRSSGASMGAATLAIFAVAALAALAFVVVTTRACDSWRGALYGGGIGGTDPYVGAGTAAAELGWRDAGRARLSYGAALTTDPVAAAGFVEPLLVARGYAEADGMTISVGRELPASFVVPELAGGCGVVEVIGEVGTRIDGGTANGEHVTASDPSLLALGACDGGEVRIEGLGRVTARVWHLPGLVPGDVAATGMPPDVLLAHAEAERVLGRYGYVASADVLRLPITATSGIVGPLPTPPSGCLPWVVVITGAGNATSGATTDRAPDRGLSLAVTCATRAGWDVATSGGGAGTAWARAFRPPGSGATLPGETPTTIGAARIVGAAEVVLGPGLPEAP